MGKCSSKERGRVAAKKAAVAAAAAATDAAAGSENPSSCDNNSSSSNKKKTSKAQNGAQASAIPIPKPAAAAAVPSPLPSPSPSASILSGDPARGSVSERYHDAQEELPDFPALDAQGNFIIDEHKVAKLGPKFERNPSFKAAKDQEAIKKEAISSSTPSTNGNSGKAPRTGTAIESEPEAKIPSNPVISSLKAKSSVDSKPKPGNVIESRAKPVVAADLVPAEVKSSKPSPDVKSKSELQETKEAIESKAQKPDDSASKQTARQQKSEEPRVEPEKPKQSKSYSSKVSSAEQSSKPQVEASVVLARTIAACSVVGAGTFAAAVVSNEVPSRQEVKAFEEWELVHPAGQDASKGGISEESTGTVKGLPSKQKQLGDEQAVGSKQQASIVDRERPRTGIERNGGKLSESTPRGKSKQSATRTEQVQAKTTDAGREVQRSQGGKEPQAVKQPATKKQLKDVKSGGQEPKKTAAQAAALPISYIRIEAQPASPVSDQGKIQQQVNQNAASSKPKQVAPAGQGVKIQKEDARKSVEEADRRPTFRELLDGAKKFATAPEVSSAEVLLPTSVEVSRQPEVEQKQAVVQAPAEPQVPQISQKPSEACAIVDNSKTLKAAEELPVPEKVVAKIEKATLPGDKTLANSGRSSKPADSNGEPRTEVVRTAQARSKAIEDELKPKTKKPASEPKAISEDVNAGNQQSEVPIRTVRVPDQEKSQTTLEVPDVKAKVTPAALPQLIEKAPLDGPQEPDTQMREDQVLELSQLEASPQQEAKETPAVMNEKSLELAFSADGPIQPNNEELPEATAEHPEMKRDLDLQAPTKVKADESPEEDKPIQTLHQDLQAPAPLHFLSNKLVELPDAEVEDIKTHEVSLAPKAVPAVGEPKIGVLEPQVSAEAEAAVETPTQVPAIEKMRTFEPGASAVPESASTEAYEAPVEVLEVAEKSFGVPKVQAEQNKVRVLPAATAVAAADVPAVEETILQAPEASVVPAVTFGGAPGVGDEAPGASSVEASEKSLQLPHAADTQPEQKKFAPAAAKAEVPELESWALAEPGMSVEAPEAKEAPAAGVLVPEVTEKSLDVPRAEGLNHEKKADELPEENAETPTEVPGAEEAKVDVSEPDAFAVPASIEASAVLDQAPQVDKIWEIPKAPFEEVPETTAKAPTQVPVKVDVPEPAASAESPDESKEASAALAEALDMTPEVLEADTQVQTEVVDQVPEPTPEAASEISEAFTLPISEEAPNMLNETKETPAAPVKAPANLLELSDSHFDEKKLDKVPEATAGTEEPKIEPEASIEVSEVLNETRELPTAAVKDPVEERAAPQLESIVDEATGEAQTEAQALQAKVYVSEASAVAEPAAAVEASKDSSETRAPAPAGQVLEETEKSLEVPEPEPVEVLNEATQAPAAAIQDLVEEPLVTDAPTDENKVAEATAEAQTEVPALHEAKVGVRESVPSPLAEPEEALKDLSETREAQVPTKVKEKEVDEFPDAAPSEVARIEQSKPDVPEPDVSELLNKAMDAPIDKNKVDGAKVESEASEVAEPAASVEDKDLNNTREASAPAIEGPALTEKSLELPEPADAIVVEEKVDEVPEADFAGIEESRPEASEPEASEPEHIEVLQVLNEATLAPAIAVQDPVEEPTAPLPTDAPVDENKVEEPTAPLLTDAPVDVNKVEEPIGEAQTEVLELPEAKVDVPENEAFAVAEPAASIEPPKDSKATREAPPAADEGLEVTEKSLEIAEVAGQKKVDEVPEAAAAASTEAPGIEELKHEVPEPEASLEPPSVKVSDELNEVTEVPAADSFQEREAPLVADARIEPTTEAQVEEVPEPTTEAFSGIGQASYDVPESKASVVPGPAASEEVDEVQEPMEAQISAIGKDVPEPAPSEEEFNETQQQRLAIAEGPQVQVMVPEATEPTAEAVSAVEEATPEGPDETEASALPKPASPQKELNEIKEARAADGVTGNFLQAFAVPEPTEEASEALHQTNEAPSAMAEAPQPADAQIEEKKVVNVPETIAEASSQVPAIEEPTFDVPEAPTLNDKSLDVLEPAENEVKKAERLPGIEANNHDFQESEASAGLEPAASKAVLDEMKEASTPAYEVTDKLADVLEAKVEGKKFGKIPEATAEAPTDIPDIEQTELSVREPETTAVPEPAASDEGAPNVLNKSKEAPAAPLEVPDVTEKVPEAQVGRKTVDEILKAVFEAPSEVPTSEEAAVDVPKTQPPTIQQPADSREVPNTEVPKPDALEPEAQSVEVPKLVNKVPDDLSEDPVEAPAATLVTDAPIDNTMDATNEEETDVPSLLELKADVPDTEAFAVAEPAASLEASEALMEAMEEQAPAAEDIELIEKSLEVLEATDVQVDNNKPEDVPDSEATAVGPREVPEMPKPDAQEPEAYAELQSVEVLELVNEVPTNLSEDHVEQPAATLVADAPINNVKTEDTTNDVDLKEKMEPAPPPEDLEVAEVPQAAVTENKVDDVLEATIAGPREVLDIEEPRAEPELVKDPKMVNKAPVALEEDHVEEPASTLATDVPINDMKMDEEPNETEHDIASVQHRQDDAKPAAAMDFKETVDKTAPLAKKLEVHEKSLEVPEVADAQVGKKKVDNVSKATTTSTREVLDFEEPNDKEHDIASLQQGQIDAPKVELASPVEASMDLNKTMEDPAPLVEDLEVAEKSFEVLETAQAQVDENKVGDILEATAPGPQSVQDLEIVNEAPAPLEEDHVEELEPATTLAADAPIDNVNINEATHEAKTSIPSLQAAKVDAPNVEASAADEPASSRKPAPVDLESRMEVPAPIAEGPEVVEKSLRVLEDAQVAENKVDDVSEELVAGSRKVVDIEEPRAEVLELQVDASAKPELVEDPQMVKEVQAAPQEDDVEEPAATLATNVPIDNKMDEATNEKQHGIASLQQGQVDAPEAELALSHVDLNETMEEPTHHAEDLVNEVVEKSFEVLKTEDAQVVEDKVDYLPEATAPGPREVLDIEEPRVEVLEHEASVKPEEDMEMVNEIPTAREEDPFEELAATLAADASVKATNEEKIGIPSSQKAAHEASSLVEAPVDLEETMEDTAPPAEEVVDAQIPEEIVGGPREDLEMVSEAPAPLEEDHVEEPATTLAANAPINDANIDEATHEAERNIPSIQEAKAGSPDAEKSAVDEQASSVEALVDLENKIEGLKVAENSLAIHEATNLQVLENKVDDASEATVAGSKEVLDIKEARDKVFETEASAEHESIADPQTINEAPAAPQEDHDEEPTSRPTVDVPTDELKMDATTNEKEHDILALEEAKVDALEDKGTGVNEPTSSVGAHVHLKEKMDPFAESLEAAEKSLEVPEVADAHVVGDDVAKATVTSSGEVLNIEEQRSELLELEGSAEPKSVEDSQMVNEVPNSRKDYVEVPATTVAKNAPIDNVKMDEATDEEEHDVQAHEEEKVEAEASAIDEPTSSIGAHVDLEEKMEDLAAPVEGDEVADREQLQVTENKVDDVVEATSASSREVLDIEELEASMEPKSPEHLQMVNEAPTSPQENHTYAPIHDMKIDEATNEEEHGVSAVEETKMDTPEVKETIVDEPASSVEASIDLEEKMEDSASPSAGLEMVEKSLEVAKAVDAQVVENNVDDVSKATVAESGEVVDIEGPRAEVLEPEASAVPESRGYLQMVNGVPAAPQEDNVDEPATTLATYVAINNMKMDEATNKEEHVVPSLQEAILDAPEVKASTMDEPASSTEAPMDFKERMEDPTPLAEGLEVAENSLEVSEATNAQVRENNFDNVGEATVTRSWEEPRAELEASTEPEAVEDPQMVNEVPASPKEDNDNVEEPAGTLATNVPIDDVKMDEATNAEEHGVPTLEQENVNALEVEASTLDEPASSMEALADLEEKMEDPVPLVEDLEVADKTLEVHEEANAQVVENDVDDVAETIATGSGEDIEGTRAKDMEPEASAEPESLEDPQMVNKVPTSPQEDHVEEPARTLATNAHIDDMKMDEATNEHVQEHDVPSLEQAKVDAPEVATSTVDEPTSIVEALDNLEAKMEDPTPPAEDLEVAEKSLEVPEAADTQTDEATNEEEHHIPALEEAKVDALEVEASTVDEASSSVGAPMDLEEKMGDLAPLAEGLEVAEKSLGIPNVVDAKNKVVEVPKEGSGEVLDIEEPRDEVLELEASAEPESSEYLQMINEAPKEDHVEELVAPTKVDSLDTKAFTMDEPTSSVEAPINDMEEKMEDPEPSGMEEKMEDPAPNDMEEKMEDPAPPSEGLAVADKALEDLEPAEVKVVVDNVDDASETAAASSWKVLEIDEPRVGDLEPEAYAEPESIVDQQTVYEVPASPQEDHVEEPAATLATYAPIDDMKMDDEKEHDVPALEQAKVDTLEAEASIVNEPASSGKDLANLEENIEDPVVLAKGLEVAEKSLKVPKVADAQGAENNIDDVAEAIVARSGEELRAEVLKPETYAEQETIEDPQMVNEISASPKEDHVEEPAATLATDAHTDDMKMEEATNEQEHEVPSLEQAKVDAPEVATSTVDEPSSLVEAVDDLEEKIEDPTPLAEGLEVAEKSLEVPKVADTEAAKNNVGDVAEASVVVLREEPRAEVFEPKSSVEAKAVEDSQMVNKIPASSKEDHVEEPATTLATYVHIDDTKTDKATNEQEHEVPALEQAEVDGPEVATSTVEERPSLLEGLDNLEAKMEDPAPLVEVAEKSLEVPKVADAEVAANNVDDVVEATTTGLGEEPRAEVLELEASAESEVVEDSQMVNKIPASSKEDRVEEPAATLAIYVHIDDMKMDEATNEQEHEVPAVEHAKVGGPEVATSAVNEPPSLVEGLDDLEAKMDEPTSLARAPMDFEERMEDQAPPVEGLEVAEKSLEVPEVADSQVVENKVDEVAEVPTEGLGEALDIEEPRDEVLELEASAELESKEDLQMINEAPAAPKEDHVEEPSTPPKEDNLDTACTLDEKTASMEAPIDMEEKMEDPAPGLVVVDKALEDPIPADAKVAVNNVDDALERTTASSWEVLEIEEPRVEDLEPEACAEPESTEDLQTVNELEVRADPQEDHVEEPTTTQAMDAPIDDGKMDEGTNEEEHDIPAPEQAKVDTPEAEASIVNELASLVEDLVDLEEKMEDPAPLAEDLEVADKTLEVLEEVDAQVVKNNVDDDKELRAEVLEPKALVKPESEAYPQMVNKVPTSPKENNVEVPTTTPTTDSPIDNLKMDEATNEQERDILALQEAKVDFEAEASNVDELTSLGEAPIDLENKMEDPTPPADDIPALEPANGDTAEAEVSSVNEPTSSVEALADLDPTPLVEHLEVADKSLEVLETTDAQFVENKVDEATVEGVGEDPRAEFLELEASMEPKFTEDMQVVPASPKEDNVEEPAATTYASIDDMKMDEATNEEEHEIPALEQENGGAPEVEASTMDEPASSVEALADLEKMEDPTPLVEHLEVAEKTLEVLETTNAQLAENKVDEATVEGFGEEPRAELLELEASMEPKSIEDMQVVNKVPASPKEDNVEEPATTIATYASSDDMKMDEPTNEEEHDIPALEQANGCALEAEASIVDEPASSVKALVDLGEKMEDPSHTFEGLEVANKALEDPEPADPKVARTSVDDVSEATDASSLEVLDIEEAGVEVLELEGSAGQESVEDAQMVNEVPAAAPTEDGEGSSDSLTEMVEALVPEASTDVPAPSVDVTEPAVAEDAVEMRSKIETKTETENQTKSLTDNGSETDIYETSDTESDNEPSAEGEVLEQANGTIHAADDALANKSAAAGYTAKVLRPALKALVGARAEIMAGGVLLSGVVTCAAMRGAATTSHMEVENGGDVDDMDESWEKVGAVAEDEPQQKYIMVSMKLIEDYVHHAGEGEKGGQ